MVAADILIFDYGIFDTTLFLSGQYIPLTNGMWSKESVSGLTVGCVNFLISYVSSVKHTTNRLSK